MRRIETKHTSSGRAGTLFILAFGSVGSCMLWSQAAQGAETKVSLAITRCDAARVSSERLFELSSSEVSAEGITLGSEPAESAARGTIELCRGSPERVRIILAMDEGRIREREVDLSDVEGELRARTIAVAFAEMLRTWRTSRAERAAPAATASTSSAPSPTPRATRPSVAQALSAPLTRLRKLEQHDPHRSSPRLELGSGLSLREFSQPTTVLAGPWLSFGAAAWSAEALYLRAHAHTPLGAVHLDSLAIAVSWTPWQFGDRLRISVALRGELGLTWAVGSPSANARAVGATQQQEQAALMSEWRFALPLSDTASLQTRLGVGVAHGPTATASRVAVATSSGGFMAAALGIYVRL